jgi:hypothetical protein
LRVIRPQNLFYFKLYRSRHLLYIWPHSSRWAAHVRRNKFLHLVPTKPQSSFCNQFKRPSQEINLSPGSQYEFRRR